MQKHKFNSNLAQVYRWHTLALAREHDFSAISRLFDLDSVNTNIFILILSTFLKTTISYQKHS